MSNNHLRNEIVATCVLKTSGVALSCEGWRILSMLPDAFNQIAESAFEGAVYYVKGFTGGSEAFTVVVDGKPMTFGDLDSE